MKGIRRIAIVSESIGYTSGVEVVIRMLVRLLKMLGAKEIVLIGPRHSAEPWEGCKCIWLRSYGLKKRGYRPTMPIAPRLNRYLVETLNDVDLVLCESVSTLVFRVMLLKRKGLISSKVIFHAHTMADRYLWAWFWIFGWLLDRAIVRRVERFCVDTADKSIAPSCFFAQYLERTIRPVKKVYPWAAPVDVPEEMLPDVSQTEAGRAVLQFKRWHDLIAVVNGRIGGEKKSKKVVRVTLGLRQMGINIGVVFVGGGEIKKVRGIITAEDRKHFLFTGVLDRWLGIAINDLADFGISLAETETESLSVLEQMKRNLFMFVCSGTVMREYVEASGGGYIIKGRSINQTAREMRGVIQGSRGSFERLGQLGSTYVSENFSEASQLAKLGELIVSP